MNTDLCSKSRPKAEESCKFQIAFLGVGLSSMLAT